MEINKEKKNFKKKILIIIPARSGSKRILNKNIKLLNKKPLIYYTIRYALKENKNARVVVSTDSKEIANLSDKFGAETPFLRSKYLSRDNTLDYPVIKDCLINLKKFDNYIPEYLIYLRPTQPFRVDGEIAKAIKILKTNPNIDTVRTVQHNKYSPFWMKKTDKKNNLVSLEKKYQKFSDIRSQDLPITYFCDGAIDASKVKSYKKLKSFSKGNVYGLLRENLHYVDIDKEDDWAYAEYLMKTKKQLKLNK